ncbi:MAG: triose-phosphate isomerase [Candidatus Sungbacteria bacterium]|nr:triose-phosphate isomerase [Candidatus Sungbacteria bacterium]
MKPLIIANWKMNPDSPGRASALAAKIERAARAHQKKVEIVIAPPFPFLPAVGGAIRIARLGAQDLFWEDKGAYTGEVSGHQLKHLRVAYAIIGHSERRMYFGETDEAVNKKIRSALAEGITPIVCVGERERDGNNIPEIVGKQVEAAFSRVAASVAPGVVVAYEPVWAISTTPGARPDTPESALGARVFIKKILSGLYGRRTADAARIIYGGSVNAENIQGFLREGMMQGALVGGASLRPAEFSSIVEQAGS